MRKRVNLLIMKVYLDNAATSYPKPDCVIKAMRGYFKNIGANCGRSAYKSAQETSRLVFETRESIAKLVGVKDSSRIVFTANATEGINTAILGSVKEGDEVITTSMEHNSVMRPLRFLEKEGKIRLEVIKCSEKGELDPDDIKNKITKKTRMVVCTSASNVVGTIMPIREVGKIVKEKGVLFLVDAAQTIGNLPIDVKKDNIDMLAFSGHKGLMGPQGTGCLYIGEGGNPVPLRFGGTGSKSECEFIPEFLPDKYESGTPNTIGIIGLGAGVDFVLKKGVESIKERNQKLTKFLLDELKKIDNVIIYGVQDCLKQTSVISFNVKGKRPSDVGEMLDKKYGIAVRCGLHCSPIAHKTMGTFPEGTIRVSTGWFNTKEEVEYFINAIKLTN